MFIVLGRTEGLRSSVRIIGRYKSEDELRDIFLTDRLRKPVRRPPRHCSEIYVFKVVDEDDEDTWYLVSFDISRHDLGRKPSKEYTIVKESMLLRFCIHIDFSTYLCPVDSSDVPQQFTDRVEVYRVKPWNDRTLNRMRELMVDTLNFVVGKLAMGSNVRGGAAKRKAERIWRDMRFIDDPLVWRKIEKIAGERLREIMKTVLVIKALAEKRK